MISTALKTYIVHYSKLKDRRLVLDKIEEIKLLKPTYILETDSLYLGQSISQNENENIRAQVKFIMPLLTKNLCKINKINENNISSAARHNIKNVLINSAIKSYSRKNIELTGQHFKAIQDFVNSNYNYALILEDDSLPFIQNQYIFSKALMKVISEIDLSKPVFVDISDSLELKYETAKNSKSLLYRVPHGLTRCASSYIINKEAAKKLLSHNSSPYLPIDWLYSYILKQHQVTTCWSSVSIFLQGSEYFYQSNSNYRNS